MRYRRSPIEVEAPEGFGYDRIRCNLAESSIRDRTLADLSLSVDLNSLILQYGEHLGHPGLRDLLAAEGGCAPDQVLLTPGAVGALYMVATSLLSPSDELVVIRPNYASNIETPRAIGCAIRYLDLSIEDGWRYTADDLARLVTPATRLISITTPHNPTGAVLPQGELRRIADLAERQGCYLLVDETYRDLQLGPIAPFASALGPHVISVGSLSKAYGLPGLRMGWLMTRDEQLFETLLAAKEQIVIALPVIEEEIAFQVYRQRSELLPTIQADLRDRLALVRGWIAQQPELRWAEPEGGVVCFPQIRPESGVDVELFHSVLRDELGTWVGPGHWFEQDRRGFRLGFGWPTRPELEEGLRSIGQALRAARR
jgi:aspartate/methionine/tyrosine aminotransferase